MSLIERVDNLAAEIGADIKAIRSGIASTKKSGRRIAADNPSGNSLGIANAIANTLRFSAIRINQEKPISAFCIYVTQIGAIARVGLFSDANENPDALLWDSGDISLSSLGLVRFSSGLPFSVLPAEDFWVSLNFYSGTGQLRAQPVLGTLYGVDLSATSTTSQFSSLSKSFAFGPMPSIAPTDLTVSGSVASSPLFFEP